MVPKITISGSLSKNLGSRIFSVKKSYLLNLSKTVELLESNELSISEIHHSAKETASKLYPLMRMLFYSDEQNKIKIFRQMMIIVSKERSSLNSRLSVGVERRDLDSLISMYFTPVVFMYTIEFSKYINFHPTILVSAYFAPILEEVGKFVDNNFATNNFYMNYRNNLKMLFLDLYIGWYKYRISNLELSIKILYNTYIKLLNDPEILTISRMDQYSQDENFIKNITLTYLSILFSGFIPETLDQIFKLGSIFEGLTKTKG